MKYDILYLVAFAFAGYLQGAISSHTESLGNGLWNFNVATQCIKKTVDGVAEIVCTGLRCHAPLDRITEWQCFDQQCSSHEGSPELLCRRTTDSHTRAGKSDSKTMKDLKSLRTTILNVVDLGVNDVENGSWNLNLGAVCERKVVDDKPDFRCHGIMGYSPSENFTEWKCDKMQCIEIEGELKCGPTSNGKETASSVGHL